MLLSSVENYVPFHTCNWCALHAHMHRCTFVCTTHAQCKCTIFCILSLSAGELSARPKLKLLPRTVATPLNEADTSTRSASIFGEGKPRDERKYVPRGNSEGKGKTDSEGEGQ